MSTHRRPPLKLRREALLALAAAVGCEQETTDTILLMGHSQVDETERRIFEAMKALPSISSAKRR